MKGKLSSPILDLSTIFEKIFSSACGKIVQIGFTAKEYADREKQKPANPAKKAQRKMIQASQRRNRI